MEDSGKISADALVVLDAVRIERQIDAIRSHYPRRVVHIHLTAPQDVLEKRYLARPKKEIRELARYVDLLKNRTERAVARLTRTADVEIDTYRCRAEDVLARAAGHIGLFGRGYGRTVDVMVGGQFGSEGKGHVAAYLAPEYDVLVRVGGPNAGHTVLVSGGEYVFHHLPSGTLSNFEAKLVIGPGAVIRVPKLIQEIADCGVSCDRLAIDEQAMVISDRDIASEKKLVQSIGSTGQGVGLATARRITDRYKKGKDALKLARDIPDLKPYVQPTRHLLGRAFYEGRKVFLEGTQGTGLSLYHGYYPHVTSRDTTVAGCLAEAGISPSRVRRVLMICRSYPIRVQDPGTKGHTSGPMSQPITWQDVSGRSGIPVDELLKNEKTSTTHRNRRVAEFDWDLLRSAASLNGPTDIALTHADYLSRRNCRARRFEQLDKFTIMMVEEIERVAAAPVSLVCTRRHERSIIDRRAWE